MTENQQSLVRMSRSELSALSLGGPKGGSSTQTQLSFIDVLRTIRRRRIAILITAVVIFGIVAVYTFLQKPVYEGLARLEVDPTRSSNLGFDDGDKSEASNTASRVKTEVSIIQSNTVAIQVMKSLRLYQRPEFAGASVIRGDIKDFAQLEPRQRQRLISRFNDNLTVRVIPDTEVIEIRFRSTDPVIATDAANSIIDEYMQRNFNLRVNGTAQVSQWLSRQLDEIRASTTIAQQKLAIFQKQNNLLGNDESDNIVTDRLKQLNEELTQAEADRIVKEGKYRLARTGNPELIASVVPGATLQVLRTQEADLEAQSAQLSAKFGTGYPKLREVQSQLNQLHAAINTEGGNIQSRLSNEYNSAAKTEAMIRRDFQKQKEAAFKLNESVAQYAILKHEVESGQQLYDTLQLKLKEADITSGLTSSYVDIIDRAQLPEKPIEPRKALNLGLGVGAGLFFGLTLGFLLDSFDDTIQTSEQLEMITALPELASIPFLSSLAVSQKKRFVAGDMVFSGSQFNLVSVGEPNGVGTEAYRSLCSVISILSVKNSLKTIVVTSAMPDEGKSTVSCNLATTLAQRGKRVLLIDADLRCSSERNEYGSSKGLGSSLASIAEYSIYRPLPHLPGLNVMPGGGRASDPTELLGSPRMRQFLAAWRVEYDHVIIDTPPVLPFSDALTLSAESDGVILVTRSDVSRTKALLRARDLLSRSGANIIGFLLNAVRRPEYYYSYPARYKMRIDEPTENVQTQP